MIIIRTYNFNFGWKFCDHDTYGKNFDRYASDEYDEPQWIKAGNNGLAIKNYDDSKWDDVNLPHDFVIEKCNFSKNVPSSVGCLEKGKGWYRKTFDLPKNATKGTRVFISFDGVYRDSQVWCNGHFLGRHLSGYSSFCYELTEVLDYEGVNTIAVFADASGYEGWWYEGGGIYRDCHMIVAPSVKVLENGVFVKPKSINIQDETCVLDVEIAFDSNNFKDVSAKYVLNIYNAKNKKVLTHNEDVNCESLAITTVKTSLNIDNVSFWDLENANLYRAEVIVSYDGKEDVYSQPFGVREVTYSVDKGMYLNGKHIVLKGVCGHDDFAGVGTALTKSVMQFKIDKLKEMGCNSYRCSHNPPSALFLELCDKSGILVMDETRLPGTSEEMLNDFVSMIKRDRNHPCVYIYSMGNEEMGIQETQIGINIFDKMRNLGTKLDNSREYLFAINCDKEKIVGFLENNGYHSNIHGVNYITNRHTPVVENLHRDHPTCCFISTETAGIMSIRDFRIDAIKRPPIRHQSVNTSLWENEKNRGIVTCYGDSSPTWGFTPERALKDHYNKPHLLGLYLWTGFDYRGETSPYDYPGVVTNYGIIDLCGFYKDWAYYMQAWWRDEPLLHILPTWNLPLKDGETVDVMVFSNCDEVELVLNGEVVDKKKMEHLGHLSFDVPYNKGILRAIGYKNGKEVLTESIVTSDIEHQLVLKANKDVILNDGSDSTIVTVEVVDKAGNLVTDSNIEVEFYTTGVGKIKGTGNGNPISIEHDKAPKRELYAGKAMVIVEGTFDAGEIVLTASSEKALSSTITIKSQGVTNFDDYIFETKDVSYGKFRIQEIDI